MIPRNTIIAKCTQKVYITGMANPSQGNNELTGFLGLEAHKREAVIQRYFHGKKHAEIVEIINANPAWPNTTVKTIESWFHAGGQLEQAVSEYTEYLGKLSLKEAKGILKRSTATAAGVLVKNLKDTSPDIQIKAAVSILDRYIPKKQIVADEDELDDDLPGELVQEANEIINGDNPPSDQNPTEPTGSQENQELPA